MVLDYYLSGFSKFEITKKKYEKFIKETKKEYYITLKKTKTIEIYLEIEDNDIKKIRNVLVYYFYRIKNKIEFKMARIEYFKVKRKEDILKNKKNILENILKKVNHVEYNIDSDSLLDFTKSKYL